MNFTYSLAKVDFQDDDDLMLINYVDVLSENVLYVVEMIVDHRNNRLLYDENNPIQSIKSLVSFQTNKFFFLQKTKTKLNEAFLRLIFDNYLSVQIDRFSRSKERKN